MYIIEGNIGAGKSTFLELIGKYFPSLNIVQEPVNSWKTQGYGQSLLANFYEDPKRWAYTIETVAMTSRVRDHVKVQNNTKQTTIMERSIYSGHHCFAQNGHMSGFMTNLEWEIYNQWFNFVVEKKCSAPEGFIYLQISPEKSYERILKRGRPEEESMSLDYLKQIHERHEDFLINKKNVNKSLKKVPVLVLDCSQEFETNKLHLNKLISSLEIFLNQTHEGFVGTRPTNIRSQI